MYSRILIISLRIIFLVVYLRFTIDILKDILLLGYLGLILNQLMKKCRNLARYEFISLTFPSFLLNL